MANDEAVNPLQEFENCKLSYDLTAHKLTVTDKDRGALLLMIQPLPDNPGGFDLRFDGYRIDIHNAVGVDFVGVHDAYEDDAALK